MEMLFVGVDRPGVILCRRLDLRSERATVASGDAGRSDVGVMSLTSQNAHRAKHAARKYRLNSAGPPTAADS